MGTCACCSDITKTRRFVVNNGVDGQGTGAMEEFRRMKSTLGVIRCDCRG